MRGFKNRILYLPAFAAVVLLALFLIAPAFHAQDDSAPPPESSEPPDTGAEPGDSEQTDESEAATEDETGSVPDAETAEDSLALETDQLENVEAEADEKPIETDTEEDEEPELIILRPQFPPVGAANLTVKDWPNDSGKAVAVLFAKSAWEESGLLMDSGEQVTNLFYVIEWAESAEGPWKEGDRFRVTEKILGEEESWSPFGFIPEGRGEMHYSHVSYELSPIGAAEGDTEVDEDDLEQKDYTKVPVFIRVGIAASDQMKPGHYFPQIGEGTSKDNWFNVARKFNLAYVVILALVMLAFIGKARRGASLYIRRIAGLEAIDEAIGRATEMGRSMYFLCGLAYASDVSTIAALNILGRVAYKVAEYESDLKVPCFDPIVMSVCQEVVKQAYTEAGRPDNYKEDNVFFLTQEQFSYVGSVNGMMVREKPAANFYFGYYYAESLLLAEAGNQIGAIQIAGTDALVQIPFFISACDYTLIGEELYAASAYISREPKLLGSIKAIDMAKLVIILVIILGSLLATITAFGGPENLEFLKYMFSSL